jgi:hypothetical protein
MSGRDRAVVTLVAAVVILFAGWHFVISPKRAKAGALATQVAAQKALLVTARAQLGSAVTARAAFASAYTQLARIGEAVPADDNVPSLIYQIQSAAKASKVDFQTLAVSSGGAAPTPTTAATTAGAKAPVQAALPPGVSVGAAGFPAEQFTFTFAGSFFRLADFFDRLQGFVVAKGNQVSISGRLMTLNSVGLSPGVGGFPNITASVSATTYLEPATQGLLIGATPRGPAATSTTQPASTPTSTTTPPAAAVGSPTR